MRKPKQHKCLTDEYRVIKCSTVLQIHTRIHTLSAIKTRYLCSPLKMCSNELLIMCHSCTSPDLVANMRCCLVGETQTSRTCPVPVTVITRICEGKVAGSQPVSGTSSGTV